MTPPNTIRPAQKARLLFDTIRHLRPGQMAAQAFVRLRRTLENPGRLLNRPVPAFPGCRWVPRAGFLPPGLQQNQSDDILCGHLSFIGAAHDVARPLDWEPAGLPKLWKYNLHYFEYLWALDFGDAKWLVTDWITRHSAAKGRTGWEPYPTSLRLINWCCYFFSLHRSATQQDAEFLQTLWSSIHRQTEWLRGHLEWHLLGNHLLENVAALSVVGNCFKGADADNWRKTGMRILSAQLAEQVLPDGGHFERSPMYQSRIVYLLATLANIGESALDAIVRDPLRRLLGALLKLCHPDGKIALLNDSALNIYNSPEQLLDFARLVDPGLTSDLTSAPNGSFALPQSGYYGYRGADSDDGDGDTYIVCDAGPLGPDYLPGHAHGDIFSFELSLKGHRVIVDSGVCGYLNDPMRAYCRSTAAHNTISVDGNSQGEFWGAFRVARRGHPKEVRWSTRANSFNLDGWHTGFDRLPGTPRHHRTFSWYGASTLLVVRDTVKSTGGPHEMVLRIHLHPECRVEQTADEAARISFGGGNFTVRFAGDGRMGIEDSWYCPEFGNSLRNHVLTFSGRSEGRTWRSAFCVIGGTAEVELTVEDGATVLGKRFGFEDSPT